jgi:hypothetical protein
MVMQKAWRDGQVDWIHRRIVNASNEISSIIRIR